MTALGLPKVVLVTGSAAGGIGGALCEEFARVGCIVYATARRLETLEALAPTGDIRKLRLDVNDAQNAEEVVQTIIDAEGRIDILINNAGVASAGAILDFTSEEIQKTFSTNLFSVLRLTQLVVPHMAVKKTSSPDEPKGLVVNLGSVLGILPIPWTGIYAATKAALASLSETMYMEFKPLGVRVMLLEPGGVKSNLITHYTPSYDQPENSLYKKYGDRILNALQVSQSSGTMDTNAFARAVVKASNLPSGGKVWNPRWYLSIGKDSWGVWFLWWLPMTFALDLIWKGLGQLK